MFEFESEDPAQTWIWACTWINECLKCFCLCRSRRFHSFIQLSKCNLYYLPLNTKSFSHTFLFSSSRYELCCRVMSFLHSTGGNLIHYLIQPRHRCSVTLSFKKWFTPAGVMTDEGKQQLKWHQTYHLWAASPCAAESFSLIFKFYLHQ